MLCPSSSSPARVARISLARQPLQSPLCQPRRQPSGPPARTNLETTRRASGKASSSMASSDGASQLKAKDITAENFAPFGQVIAPTDDGKHFDESDAQLVLSGGVPRFYIMRLPRRGLSFKTIVHHAIVTQCLGSTQAEPWYMAVAAKDVETPSADNMHAFRIPPGKSQKASGYSNQTTQKPPCPSPLGCIALIGPPPPHSSLPFNPPRPFPSCANAAIQAFTSSCTVARGTQDLSSTRQTTSTLPTWSCQTRM
mmetsp:Transcript_6066/g.14983  ORF Transcript_6066/g.14983 Transcript_6066/m.14983 type:complete len:254 (-) Transcript_6066:198-959(-)